MGPIPKSKDVELLKNESIVRRSNKIGVVKNKVERTTKTFRRPMRRVADERVQRAEAGASSQRW